MEYTFEGITICQHPGIEQYFPQIINDFNRIIELGTYSGGLSLYLHRIKNDNTELITYDCTLRNYAVPEEQAIIDRRFGNFAEKAYQEEIGKLISDPLKKVLVLCDGDDKNVELNIFCKYLKEGDVIMTHDYAESDEDWHKHTDPIGWYYSYEPFGSCYDKIKISIDEGYIEKYKMYDEFKSVLWGAFTKPIN